MLLSVDTPEYDKYMVYDCEGHLIPYVVSFDTTTEEIELSVGVHRKRDEKNDYSLLMQATEMEDGQVMPTPIIVKFKLPGAYAKKDNEPIH